MITKITFNLCITEHFIKDAPFEEKSLNDAKKTISDIRSQLDAALLTAQVIADLKDYKTFSVEYILKTFYNISSVKIRKCSDTLRVYHVPHLTITEEDMESESWDWVTINLEKGKLKCRRTLNPENKDSPIVYPTWSSVQVHGEILNTTNFTVHFIDDEQIKLPDHELISLYLNR